MSYDTSDCLPPDLELQLNAPMLRSYLAEAAYRQSVRSLGEARWRAEQPSGRFAETS
jgi:hypothetical protein